MITEKQDKMYEDNKMRLPADVPSFSSHSKSRTSLLKCFILDHIVFKQNICEILKLASDDTLNG